MIAWLAQILRWALGIHPPSPSKAWLEAHRRLTGQDIPVQPWPLVPECHGHGGQGGPESCSQCAGLHEHRWVAFNKATRCVVCGGRKCDWLLCVLRRHHTDEHLLKSGERIPLGGGPDEPAVVTQCPGPLVWFDVAGSRSETPAGVLECSAEGCGYVVMTGTPNDARHADTPHMKEGLA